MNWQEIAAFPYAQFAISRVPAPSESTTPPSLEDPLPTLPLGADLRCDFQPRWLPRWATQWDVLKDEVVRPAESGTCSIYYAFPKRTPGFMSVSYLLCGEGTDYQTLRTSVDLLQTIATARNSQAIVCQAFSKRLSVRLLNRWGYVQHAQSLGPNHFIKRLR